MKRSQIVYCVTVGDTVLHVFSNAKKVFEYFSHEVYNHIGYTENDIHTPIRTYMTFKRRLAENSNFFAVTNEGGIVKFRIQWGFVK
jgi:hypothetical protein